MSHYKEPVYQVLADSRLESALTKGQTIARSYASDVTVNDMGGDGSYSTQAITDTQETLVINKEKEASIYIKKLDELQAHLPVKKKYGQKLGNALVNQIDGDVLLAAYQGAGTTIDDGSFAGTSGNGYAVTATNVASLFATAMQKLRLKNTVYNKRFRPSAGMKIEVPDGMPMAVVPQEVLTAIELYTGGKDTLLGDQVSRNGYSGYFHGFEVFASNALPWTGTLALATQPTDGDTIIFNGVTLRFKTTLAAAGDLLIGANAAASNDALVAMINDSESLAASTEGTLYWNVSAANRKLLKNVTATDGTTATTFVASGWGTVEVSETLTDTTDGWTVGKEIVHAVFGLSKSVSLVIQKYPSLEENFVSGKIGRDYIAWTVYGIKVFNDQAPQLVAASILSTSYTAAATTVN